MTLLNSIVSSRTLEIFLLLLLLRFLGMSYIDNYADCLSGQFVPSIPTCVPFLSLALLYQLGPPEWYWIWVVKRDIPTLFPISALRFPPLNFFTIEYDVALNGSFEDVLNQIEDVCWEFLSWINIEYCQMHFPNQLMWPWALIF